MGMYKDGVLTCVSDAAMAANRLVVLTGNLVGGMPEVTYADDQSVTATDTVAIGTTTMNASAAAIQIGVKLWMSEGTHSMTTDLTNDALAVGDVVVQFTDGTICKTGDAGLTQTVIVGLAMEACSVANTGTEIEVLVVR